MAVKDFRDLMRDLEATDRSTDVYVALLGWRYHSRIDCSALRASKQSQVCRLPLKLAEWLGYEKQCGECWCSDEKRRFL